MSVFSYEGKRVVIAGCFSGVGEATARRLIELGAEVHGVDVRPSAVPMASFRLMDLTSTESIDAAVDTIGGRIDALFNCAGLPQTFPAAEVMKVNFIGMRHWIERWVEHMPNGGAIVTVASNAALRYQQRLPVLLDLIATADAAAALAWVERHADVVADGYGISKEAIVVYTQKRAVELATRGIRLNVTLPGPIATPMMDEFVKVAPAEVFDVFAEPVGRLSTALEQADPLVFLNSDAARFLSGVAMPVDHGFAGGVTIGAIDVAEKLATAREAARA